MIGFVEYLNVPAKIALVIIAVIFVIQLIGELCEFFGKTVPEMMKIRKYFKRKKQERIDNLAVQKEVKRLLEEVNGHYSADNIAKRDSWMQWVNSRADVYDSSIVEIGAKLDSAVQALNNNTKMTEEMFVQTSRDRIIDFATKVSSPNAIVSREEFNRIFKVYEKYEAFLKDHDMTNGEIDINYQIIKESYEAHLKNHTFLEDARGYNK